MGSKKGHFWAKNGQKWSKKGDFLCPKMDPFLDTYISLYVIIPLYTRLDIWIHEIWGQKEGPKSDQKWSKK